MDNQFKILDQKTVFKSTKLQIDRAKISLPNGNIVEWDANILPPFYFGVPIVDGKVMMTKEWRLGPNKIITQFVGARCVSNNQEENIKELERELKEELGLEGGLYLPLVKYLNGVRTSGEATYFTVENFTTGETERDWNEIQEIVLLPIEGLYTELLTNHQVTSDVLLIAKLLEEKLK